MAKTLHTDESVVIDRPLPEVFEYLTDPAHALEWGTNVSEYQLVSGARDEVGAVASLDARAGGVRLHMTERITGYEKNKRIAFESAESRVGYSREIDFESDRDGGTKVTFLMDAEAGSGIFKFADPIVQRLYARDVRNNLENAKTILESTTN